MYSDYFATNGHQSVTNGQSQRPIRNARYSFQEIAKCQQTVQLQSDIFNDPLAYFILQCVICFIESTTVNEMIMN
jgi:hypothetical protein